VGGSGTNGLSLQVGNRSAVLLALSPSGVVALHAVQEILTAARVPDMLGPDADFLFLDPISHRLRHNHAQGPRGHVEHATGATVIVLEGHAPVDGTISFDVDNVADLVDLEQSGDRWHSILFVIFLEHVSGALAVSL